MEITLDHTEKINYNVTTFWFKPERQVKYTAGQFIEMFLPHDNPDERGIKHWFTLSSSPTEELICITTKFFGDTASTFKKTLFSLKPSAKIKIVEPMGDFVLPKSADIPLVFVAGGIGITPFRSMIKWLKDSHEKRDIEVILAANQPKDFLFVDLFKDYGVKLKQIVSEPDESWDGEVGKLSADKIIELTGQVGHKHVYVSGPEPMVETLEKDLLSHGVKNTQLILDFFPNYKADLS